MNHSQAQKRNRSQTSQTQVRPELSAAQGFEAPSSARPTSSAPRWDSRRPQRRHRARVMGPRRLADGRAGGRGRGGHPPWAGVQGGQAMELVLAGTQGLPLQASLAGVSWCHPSTSPFPHCSCHFSSFGQSFLMTSSCRVASMASIPSLEFGLGTLETEEKPSCISKSKGLGRISGCREPCRGLGRLGSPTAATTGSGAFCASTGMVLAGHSESTSRMRDEATSPMASLYSSSRDSAGRECFERNGDAADKLTANMIQLV